MIALFADNNRLVSDIGLANGLIIAAGFDLLTAVDLSLRLDAPAQPGDVLPQGTPRGGYWADVFFPSQDVTGSRLWLLRNATPTEPTARRAEAYAAEALHWLIATKIVRSIQYATEIKPEAIWLAVDLYPPLGAPKTFGPLKVT